MKQFCCLLQFCIQLDCSSPLLSPSLQVGQTSQQSNTSELDPVLLHNSTFTVPFQYHNINKTQLITVSNQLFTNLCSCFHGSWIDIIIVAPLNISIHFSSLHFLLHSLPIGMINIQERQMISINRCKTLMRNIRLLPLFTR